MVGDSAIRRQIQVHEKFSKKKVAAPLLVEHQTVLANPTQTRSGCPSALHDRRRIHKSAAFNAAPIPAHPFEQLLELPLHHVVVILTKGVRRNARRFGVLLTLLGEMVVQQADDRLGAGHQQCRVQTLVEVALEVAHLPVPALREPLFKPLFFRFKTLGLREADRSEAQFSRPQANLIRALLPDVPRPPHAVQSASNKPPPALGTLPR